MKLLYVTSLSGVRINGFMRSAIVAAKSLGIEFTMACNMDDADMELYNEDCKEYGIKTVHIDFDRNPLGKKNLLAKKQLFQLMEKEKYDAVHCNTPIGGVIGRICAKKANIPYVIYQAHGFHFWKGAPLKNWLFYYPVERYLARYTDVLVTINHEDYQRAKKFHLKDGGRVEYVHGVGVNMSKVSEVTVDRERKRNELGIPENAELFVTVGELIDRKNQVTAIDAFEKAKITNAHLIICGQGERMEYLRSYIKSKGLASCVHLLGFRQDITEVLKASDVFVFPSLQEGLPVALMEAMACGLPCVASRIRGNTDLLGEQYNYLFEPKDVERLSVLLSQIVEDKTSIGAYCVEAVKLFDFFPVVKEFESLYSSIWKV